MTTTRSTGSAFRRVGKSALAASAAAGTIACLVASLPAHADAVHPAAPARQTAVAAPEAPPASDEAADIDAYYAAGYSYDDAIGLAALWNSASRHQAKFTAGAELLAGRRLPFAPGEGLARRYTEAQRLHAFTVSDYADPVVERGLASYWGTTVRDAEVRAGALVLAGKPVPLDVSPADGTDVEAFFGAGYTYQDAVKLAALWHTATPYDAKVQAGQALRASPQVPLPIRP